MAGGCLGLCGQELEFVACLEGLRVCSRSPLDVGCEGRGR